MLPESEMSPIVSTWLRERGYSVYSEIEALGGPIDHVGVRWSDEAIVCVEMKTTCSRTLLYQGMRRQLITESVYVAVPKMPRNCSLDRAKRFGLGMLVNGAVHFEPQTRCRAVSHYRDRLLQLCKRAPEGGVGGLPTLKGDGPAVRCAAAVHEYRTANPRASWEQIFRDVPNHYRHPRSMACALRHLLLKLL